MITMMIKVPSTFLEPLIGNDSDYDSDNDDYNYNGSNDNGVHNH